MRRKDREITDPAKMEDVVRRCVCCRIGFCDQGEVYIVPLNFGYEKKDGVYTFYFHGAREGRKIDLMQASPRVGFEMDTGYALSPRRYGLRLRRPVLKHHRKRHRVHRGGSGGENPRPLPAHGTQHREEGLDL